MIVKILSGSATFAGVTYNFRKIDWHQGELMAVRNFGALQNLSVLRPEDYRNYLKAVSARNKRVSAPQFHAVISAQGTTTTQEMLTQAAIQWLGLMGYAEQPYLIIFHRDTANHHVHMVSTRIDKQGKKISSAFERIRAIENLNRVLGKDATRVVQDDIDAALKYQFTSKAQFCLLLELRGYQLKEDAGRIHLFKSGQRQASIGIELLERKLAKNVQRNDRIQVLKAIFHKYASGYNTKLENDHIKLPAGRFKPGSLLTSDFSKVINHKFGLELVFHCKGDQAAYGYTVLDHATKNVFKGGEILPLQKLLSYAQEKTTVSQDQLFQAAKVTSGSETNEFPHLPDLYDGALVPLVRLEHFPDKELAASGTDVHSSNTNIKSVRINIASDVDDEAVHGRNRRKKRKARTNSR